MTLACYDFLRFIADTGSVYEESRREIYDCGNTCSLWYIKDKKNSYIQIKFQQELEMGR